MQTVDQLRHEARRLSGDGGRIKDVTPEIEMMPVDFEQGVPGDEAEWIQSAIVWRTEAGFAVHQVLKELGQRRMPAAQFTHTLECAPVFGDEEPLTAHAGTVEFRHENAPQMRHDEGQTLPHLGVGTMEAVWRGIEWRRRTNLHAKSDANDAPTAQTRLCGDAA